MGDVRRTVHAPAWHEGVRAYMAGGRVVFRYALRHEKHHVRNMRP